MRDQQTSNWLGTALLAAGLLAIFVGERVFADGGLRYAVTGLGALLLLGACALRGRTYARSTGDVRGVEGRLLLAYGGVLFALLLYAASTDAALNALGLEDTARDRLSGSLSVLWPTVLLVSLAALLFMELVYARMPLAASVELRRVRTAAYAGLTLALSTVFVLSLNYVATARDVRKDVSYFKTTVPSEGTKAMLAKLQTPVKVLLFYRRSDDVAEQVEPYFAALSQLNPKISYEVLDFALVPEVARKHRITGNGSVLLIAGEGENPKAESIRIGTELTTARPQLRKLDALFQENFGRLVRPERSVQMTIGHGERNTPGADPGTRGDGIRLLEEIWGRLNVQTSQLGISQGLANAVPDGAGAVVVMGPSKKFLPEEVQALLTYVRKGGRLLLMVDPQADDGLDPLLAGLGVKRLPGVMAATTSHMRRKFDSSDRVVVFSSSYSSHPSVSTASRLSAEVATLFYRGVALDAAEPEAGAPRPRVTFPLRSGEDFFRDLDGDYERDPNEKEERLNMIGAISVTEKEGAPEGRAVIVGDGDFMTDKLAGNNGNLTVFIDAVAWLIGNEELNAEVSSEEDIPIEHSRDKDKLWFYATTFAAPFPLLGLSGWVARRRRRSGERNA